jgi:3,4-dihydroxy 2-butanone 4-phosphate synthase/GTP cyclohydrolase II
MTDAVETAVAAIGRGEIVVVTDDAGRENEGDLVMSASHASPEAISFFLKHTSGLICVAIEEPRARELDLPLMVAESTDARGTAFTVSVDLAEGMTTGISAVERAATIAALASPTRTRADFVRPGHVFPLRARPGGVLRRGGHTEAGIDLARIAGVAPAAALCEVVSDDKMGMASGAELRRLADFRRLPLVSVAELVRYRLSRETLVEHVAGGRLPTALGEIRCEVWRSDVDDVEHVALVVGDVETPEPVLVRVHSECLTGDVFGSVRCDCGKQLEDSLALIQREGRGVVVYLRGHEGRGIGLSHKLRAYNLQDEGLDTVDANTTLGLPVDTREYGVGAQILRGLGVRRLRLITNNPAKYEGLGGFGLEVVERVGRPPSVTPENLRYLTTKRNRLGHLLPAELEGMVT